MRLRCAVQTSFTLAQLADPDIAEADRILRACVHCGFCTATCPTFVLLGDELDSPRGRIYLIKDMLEHDRPVTAKLVKHIDRCLSCLSCMTTCPSGVHYMHLVDHARTHIEAHYRRPFMDRLLRKLLALLLPHPSRFRLAMTGTPVLCIRALPTCWTNCGTTIRTTPPIAASQPNTVMIARQSAFHTLCASTMAMPTVRASRPER